LLNFKNKIRILIADNVGLSGLNLLPRGNFVVRKKIGISNNGIINNYKNFDVLAIRSTRKIDKNFIDNCNFSVIASFTKGIDHIDTEAAKDKKIKILYSESGNTVSAAEHTFGLILAVYKNLFLSDRLVRKNKFSFYDYKRNELKGKKIGIVGFGKVGSKVAKFANAFEMKIIANDTDKKVVRKNKNYEFKNLDFLLKNADIITVHIPLNAHNKNFIDSRKLNLISKNTMLVNTSRGEVIDENYLIKLLEKRRIYYAGLDVFRNEPNINNRFFKLENVLLTNHIAGKTEDSSKYISNDIFMQVKKHFSAKTKKNG